jgi:hypothetical protein
MHSSIYFLVKLHSAQGSAEYEVLLETFDAANRHLSGLLPSGKLLHLSWGQTDVITMFEIPCYSQVIDG